MILDLYVSQFPVLYKMEFIILSTSKVYVRVRWVKLLSTEGGKQVEINKWYCFYCYHYRHHYYIIFFSPPRELSRDKLPWCLPRQANFCSQSPFLDGRSTHTQIHGSKTTTTHASIIIYIFNKENEAGAIKKNKTYLNQLNKSLWQ